MWRLCANTLPFHIKDWLEHPRILLSKGNSQNEPPRRQRDDCIRNYRDSLTLYIKHFRGWMQSLPRVHHLSSRKHTELTKKEWSLKVGVSGVPWLYMDILLWRAATLFPAPEDGVMSSTSNGLQNNRTPWKRACENHPSSPDRRPRKHLVILTEMRASGNWACHLLFSH